MCIWVRVGVRGRLTFLGEALPTHHVDKPAQGSRSHLHKEPPSSVWIWRPMAAGQEDVSVHRTSPLSWSQKKKKSIICVANRHFYITNY